MGWNETATDNYCAGNNEPDAAVSAVWAESEMRGCIEILKQICDISHHWGSLSKGYL